VSALDQTAQIRPGEELDLGRLSAYLRATLPVPVDTLAVEQFPGGHSNLTYLVRVDGQEYVLRRPPFGNQVKSAHDMGREFRVLSALAPVFPPAPRPVLYCDDPSVLGAPFYLMERRRGIVLRRMLPEDFRLDAATASEL
jgi:aminoglycoside phosphotransferase (APT) family kinase protein